MFRRALPPDEGMVVPYDPPQPVGFWMKNTLIPLDMLFIGADQRVGRIAADVPPLSLDTVPSGIPVTAVLELRGGRAAELGISVGDRVEWQP